METQTIIRFKLANEIDTLYKDTIYTLVIVNDKVLVYFYDEDDQLAYDDGYKLEEALQYLNEKSWIML